MVEAESLTRLSSEEPLASDEDRLRQTSPERIARQKTTLHSARVPLKKKVMRLWSTTLGSFEFVLPLGLMEILLENALRRAFFLPSLSEAEFLEECGTGHEASSDFRLYEWISMFEVRSLTLIFYRSDRDSRRASTSPK